MSKNNVSRPIKKDFQVTYLSQKERKNTNPLTKFYTNN